MNLKRRLASSTPKIVLAFSVNKDIITTHQPNGAAEMTTTAHRVQIVSHKGKTYEANYYEGKPVHSIRSVGGKRPAYLKEHSADFAAIAKAAIAKAGL